MKTTQTVLETILEKQLETRTLTRGMVLSVSDDGPSMVICGDQQVRCDVLHTSAEPLLLARGDIVLVWLPAEDSHGVILGRIGPSVASPSQTEELPQELVLEAKQNLTLKCGDGAITIRADGKVLIKGTDLVSHAQRTNRIKGGSVAIN